MKLSPRVPPLLACLVGFVATGAPAPSLAADQVIKIGGLLPISGPGSYFGLQDKQGVELALDQLNKVGVNGYKFDVHYEDSACSPLPATQAAKRLLDQYQPDIVIGEECSDATLAVMPVMDQAKVSAPQCWLFVDQDYRPWQPVDLPDHAQRGHAGYRHSDQC